MNKILIKDLPKYIHISPNSKVVLKNIKQI